MGSKSGHPATTTKSLNAMQGRFAIQQNGDSLAKTTGNAYHEDQADANLGHAQSHPHNAAMAQQVRVSSKDGARKKKSQSLARYQFKNA